MDFHPSASDSQPLAPPSPRVSVWVRVRPFVTAFILVGVSFVGLHLWDQIGALDEGTASSGVVLRSAGVEAPRTTTPVPIITQASRSAVSPLVGVTPTRPPATPLPLLPTASPIVAALKAEGITPIIPDVLQVTTMNLVITIVEPTATHQPTTRPPQRPLPAVPTAAPLLPSRPVPRPPVIVPPPPEPAPAPTAWRVPVQTPGNWTRPRPVASPAP